MRILAITLYSGENELDACLAAIRGQTLPAAEHLVFEHLPKREAHEKLYGTFMRRRDEFDLLIKVDADLVLCREDFFERVAGEFVRWPEMGLLEVKVRDWFTDRLMNGINCYRNTIRWDATGDLVFTDRFAGAKQARGHGGSHLVPAADHSPDPSPWQAFHFGVHRGVKAAVALQRGLHETVYMRHRDVERTWRHFLRRGDPRLGLAALGGELGMQGRFDGTQLDYRNPETRAAFETFAQLDAAALRTEVLGLRLADGGRWPWLIRQELRRGRDSTLPLRCLAPLPLRQGARRVLRGRG